MLIRAWMFTWGLLALGPFAYADGDTKPTEILAAPQRWQASGPGGAPGFTRQVQPLLGKLGCSNRACHGSFQGQGGFRLSLFASDPRLDHDGLVKEARVDLADPDESLMLLKPTRQIAHKGGRLFEKDSWQYRLLREWIASGAPFVPKREPTIERLELRPPSLVLSKPGATGQLRVWAQFSDHTVEDVTALAQFASNDDTVVTVNDAGQALAGRAGDTALIVSFGSEVASVPVLVPRLGAGERDISFPANNPLDKLVGAKLTKLGIVPSELCSDEEFLRRVSLDITGTLPTPQEVLAFVADPAPAKRQQKIDELLERPAYAAWWTTKLCDLTGLNAPALLGSTDFGPLVGDQWHRWILRRVQDNVGYDRLVAGIVLGTSRKKGQSYLEFVREQSAYVRTANTVDFAAQDQMPHFWFRGNLQQPEEKALAFAYTFLGVRLECAQCHKHPFDRWTQRDFQQFTALFERIRWGVAPDAVEAQQQLKDSLGVTKTTTAAVRRQLYWKLARQDQPVPWPEVYIGEPKRGSAQAQGKLLGGAAIDLMTAEDPRVPLMDWLRRPDNPYFAPAFVNRVWSHYYGKGLVNPPDDHNLANPPSNQELLAYLAQEFIEHGFDMKWLHRTIAGSRTYQLSWQPNDSNRDDERNFSRALIRRLPAEVAVDALLQATASRKQLGGAAQIVKDRKISQQPPASVRRLEFPLTVFGKPLRQVNCDCERETDPSLLQALFLRNDQELLAMIDRPASWIRELAGTEEADALIREAYLRTLSRLPDEREWARCRQQMRAAKDQADGLRDLLWALLNTQEFITNH